VLEDGWVFSQLAPLTTEEFVRAAAGRGYDLKAQHLGVLARSGLLVPALAIVDGPARSPVVRTNAQLLGSSTTRRSLDEAAAQGRIIDPALSPLPVDQSFEPRKRVDSTPSRWNGLLYSPWQVLGLASLRSFFTRDGKPIHQEWAGLPPQPVGDPTAARDHQTALVLTAIEPRYLPELNEGLVSLTNADFDQWEEYRESFSAIDLAGRLGVDADEAYRRGEQLLMRARSIDPLGPWHHVVRHGDRRSQDRLSGDARLALDHRRAAELMLLFAGDLDGKLRALAPPTRVGHPTDDRLSRHGEALDEALIDLGVSPHPRVLLILEGETEGILARKVLDHLSLRLRDDELRIVLMRGVTQKSRILKLAAEAATPAIGEAARDHYSLRRPPTRIVVATDPERPMQDPTVFEAHLTREIIHGLADQGVTDVNPDEIQALISIDVWEAAFEFAHFTDEEIADALESLPERPFPGTSHAEAVAFVANARQGQRSLTKNNQRLSKTRLAEALWPALAGKVDAAVAGFAPVPPIVQVVSDAHGMAVEARMKHYVIGRLEPHIEST